MKPSFSRRTLYNLFSAIVLVSTPSITTLPLVGRSRAPIMLRRVVFPLPDGPNIAINSPSFTLRSTALSATTLVLPLPYTFVTLLATTIFLRGASFAGLLCFSVNACPSFIKINLHSPQALNGTDPRRSNCRIQSTYDSHCHTKTHDNQY